MGKVEDILDEQTKRLLEGLEIVKIRLGWEAHNDIKKELEEDSKVEIDRITSLFGIPVEVRTDIPRNTVLLVSNKVSLPSISMTVQEYYKYLQALLRKTSSHV